MTEVAAFDPVRQRFIDALAMRAEGQPDAVRRVIESRLATLRREYQQRAAQAQGDAGRLADDVAARERRVPPSPLAALLAHVAGQAPGVSHGDTARDADGRQELRSLRHFRAAWAQLSVEQTVAAALATAPANAGPLNSHSLMLQSLRAMREISPAYLSHFIAYADSLLWLDQAHKASVQAKKDVVRKAAGKKRKAGK